MVSILAVIGYSDRAVCAPPPRSPMSQWTIRFQTLKISTAS